MSTGSAHWPWTRSMEIRPLGDALGLPFRVHLAPWYVVPAMFASHPFLNDETKMALPNLPNVLKCPETIESVFYMYRFTGDRKYQDWGWAMLQSLEKHLRVETGGYSGVRSVEARPLQFTDKQESFFLAETLKYLYLLFSPTDLIDVNEFVFNTEAHPVRILKDQQ